MRKYLLLVFATLLISCSDAGKKTGTTNVHFDVQRYFEGEAARMQKLDPTVRKAVQINGGEEIKDLKIKDWKKELEIFTAADINKVDWEGLINVQRNDTLERYTSASEKVFVKQLSVEKRAGKPNKIAIIVQRSNVLYNSTDTLLYIPDSLYSITKEQNIRLLKGRNYRVMGIIK